MSNVWAVKNVAFFLAVMLSAAPLAATEKPDDVDFNPFGSEEASEPSQSKMVIDQSPVITQLVMDNASISEPFMIISDTAGWSIFPTEEVSRAKISFSAKDISAQQLLDTVITLAGFVYHRENNIVTVMTYDEYAQFYGLEKKVIPLEYANADSIAAVIKEFLSKPGKSVIHSQTNTIVLFESTANLDTIVRVIEELDVPVEAETTITVVDLNYMDAEVMAQTLERVFSDDEPRDSPVVTRQEDGASDPSSERITAPRIVEEKSLSAPRSRVGIYAIGRTNQLIVKALQSDMEELKRLVEILDIYVEPTTQSYHFTYVDAAEVYDGLEEILDIPTRGGRYGRSAGQSRQQGGRPAGLTLITRTNSILLTRQPSVHRVMASIYETIDVPGMYKAGTITV